MKKIIAGVLAMMMAVTVLCAWAEEAGEPAESRLKVGNPTPMRGQFFTEMWGNSTTDADVRDLLHAYNLIYWDSEFGLFTVDPSVVSGVAAMKNDKGDHIYIMVLYDDLYYSDGTKITAWDYAFSYLFSISPALSEIGARPLRREQIAGYRSYIENGGPLSGVRVLSDDAISVTLNHEYLPFFYEMGLLSCNPYPISVIAPGVTVRDDGEGVYLANIDKSVKEPVFTADLLRSTVLDPETGYISHPSVVSGPYTLTSWDGRAAEFEINPRYKGNNREERPTIQHLTYTPADIETMTQQLMDGEFDLLNKVIRTDKIMEGIEQVGNGMKMSSYPRLGLSYISFSCERPAVADPAVRKAIAFCFDRNKTVTDYTGQFGMRVDGYYGIGQWMYEMISGATAYPLQRPDNEDDAEAVAAYEEKYAEYETLTLDRLHDYELDTAEAARLLTEAGWKVNGDGLREKDGVVLDLRLIYPEGNSISEILQNNLAVNLASVGIKLTMEAVPMDELLSRWYQQKERNDDMIYLASNFNIVFDPSVNFAPDGSWTYTNLQDEQLYNAAVAMRTTEPGDVLTYLKHWIEFQERFNEVLPMIPVYSNVYFDFYRNDLQNYAIAANTTWGQAIVGAWLGEDEEILLPEGEDDSIIFR